MNYYGAVFQVSTRTCADLIVFNEVINHNKRGWVKLVPFFCLYQVVIVY